MVKKDMTPEDGLENEHKKMMIIKEIHLLGARWTVGMASAMGIDVGSKAKNCSIQGHLYGGGVTWAGLQRKTEKRLNPVKNNQREK